MNQTKPDQLNIASAEHYGASAQTEHIVQAIKKALGNAKLKSASSVLLFLTNGYNQNLKIALKTAAKAAGTLQVYGATATGLFTEKNWILDHEGAVAMIFPENCDLQPANLLNTKNQLSNSLPLLCLSSPEQSKLAINHKTWNDYAMYGAVTSNTYGISEYPIWQASRVSKEGYIHANFNSPFPLKAHTIISQGVRRISKNLRLSKVEGNSISKVGKTTPIDSLQSSLPDNMYSMFIEQPYHTLCAVSESTQQDVEGLSAVNALNKNFYQLFNIVGINEKEHSVYLSGRIKQGQYCFWALRDNSIAEQEWNHSLKKLSKNVKKPSFAIFFCSESRGPYFHNSKEDKDLELFKKYFPNTPLIGIYSSSEITAGAHYKTLLRRYSSSLTLYSI